jgi:hypothetical protein
MPFSWALVIELKGREVAVTKAIGSAAEAAVEMSVLDAHGLHEGMGHNRTDKSKSSLSQCSCELA